MDQQEQREWEAVNRLLQHHGFKPVSFADPTENKNLAELVLMERKSAADIRLMFKTMLSDSERRQGLIQELIQSNNQLKEEMQQHQVRAARQSQRAAELEGILDGVKVKVQELEDSYISKAAQQHSQFTQLQQEKKDAERQCHDLQQKLSREKDQASQLQKKLQYAVREEERHVARRNQAFQQIHRRSVRPDSTLDQQILDVIDVYESQIQQLRNELKMSKSSSGDSSNSQRNRSNVEKDPTDTLSNYRTLLKSYQEQLKETKAQREELKTEIQKLKEDLESRPTVKELKTCKQQLRRMDRIIQQSNIKSCVKTQDTPETLNTDKQHLDASTCKRCLMDVCKELKVKDVSRLLSEVKDRCKEAESASGMEKILCDVTGVLTNPRAPLGLLREQGEFELIVPTLEVWSQQLNALSELHRALSRLQKRLSPWQPEGGTTAPSDSVRVEDLMLIVDTLLDETASDDKVLRSPTRHTLESMVGHFQRLFDAPSLTGVYPRMNEVYGKLGEMNNAMRNLRDVLDLDDGASPSEVVNKVAAIVSHTSNGADGELYNLLETSDIDSIIVKLKEHEDFFPAFHSFIQELLQTVDVQNLDEVLPTVRSLKSTL